MQQRNVKGTANYIADGRLGEFIVYVSARFPPSLFFLLIYGKRKWNWNGISTSGQSSGNNHNNSSGVSNFHVIVTVSGMQLVENEDGKIRVT